MAKSASAIAVASLTTFGDFLRFLRQRADLTQLQLAIAVGYSDAQINRLERNVRSPDLTVVAARFIEALFLEDAPDLAARLLELAGAAQRQRSARSGTIAVTRSVTQEISEEIEWVEETPLHNLPRRLTSFLGREQESDAVLAALRRSPLLTLTGAGGCGKTSLAIESARKLYDSAQALGGLRRPRLERPIPEDGEAQGVGLQDGVWLVELASLEDAAFVPRAVKQALAIQDRRDLDALDSLVETLRSRSLLLLLDNCEHVVDGAANLAARLLQACPRLSILATSREALNIPGETVFVVSSLPFPPEQSAPELDRLPEYAAVRLFVERGQAVLPGFRLTGQNARAVAQICRMLDGIPLALELAAGRVRLLQVEEIAVRLAQSLDLLTGGSRAALPRHQTLAAAIGWSYDLLPAGERDLLRRLAVFASGFTLEAAEALFATPLQPLTQLVNKSLVMADRQPGTSARYRLLEMIRQFADRLLTGAERKAARDGHLAYFTRLVEDAAPRLRGPNQIAWLDRLEVEHDNIRAALRWALESDAVVAFRLVVLLDHFWGVRGHSAEQRAWVSRCVAAPDAPLTGDYVKTLCLEAYAWGEGRDDARAASLLAQSLCYCEEIRDPRVLAFVLERQGWVLWWRDLEQTRQLFLRSLALYEAAGDLWSAAQVHLALGEFHQARGLSLSIAAHHLQAGLRLSRQLGDLRGIAQALIHLSDGALGQGDAAAAEAYGQEGVALARSVGFKIQLTFGLTTLALAIAQRGELKQAIALAEESVALMRDFGICDYLALSLHGLGTVLRYQGDLVAAQTAFEECLAVGWQLVDQRDLICALACRGLGDIARLAGDFATAQEQLLAAIGYYQASDYERSLHNELDILANTLAAQALRRSAPPRTDDLRKAATLWGAADAMRRAADAMRRAADAGLPPLERADRDAFVSASCDLLGAPLFDSAWASGQALSRRQVLMLILDQK